ncbi:MAG: sulfite exporter TauE/SafE family protein [Sulfurovum sp.]|nr:sulfite exporter TauE/SafE family protein [Sulfurovum sp.]
METFSYFSLFMIGVSYGSTACMFTCMPFLSPLLVNHSGTIKQSIGIVLPFSLGRIFSYTMISIIALSSAGLIKAILDDNAIFQFILGIFTMMMGFFMLYRVFGKNKKSCASNSPIPNKTGIGKFGLFGIGAMVALNPCAPILTLIALAANSKTLINAIGMGVSFGIGAALIPFLFYGFFLSGVMRGLLMEFRSYAKAIEVAASLLLLAVGVLILNSQIAL